MFWLTVLGPLLAVLMLWPWRRTVRVFRKTVLTPWEWFDVFAPYIMLLFAAVFVLVWRLDVVPFGVMNGIAIGLGMAAFGLVIRVLALAWEGEDA